VVGWEWCSPRFVVGVFFKWVSNQVQAIIFSLVVNFRVEDMDMGNLAGGMYVADVKAFECFG